MSLHVVCMGSLRVSFLQSKDMQGNKRSNRQSKLSVGVNGLVLFVSALSRKHAQCFSLVDIDPHRSETAAEGEKICGAQFIS